MWMTTACASFERGDPQTAPQPLKPIEQTRFYTGRWYEIARTPSKLTKNCVAGTTDYFRASDSDGELIDRDACRMGTPEGPEKTFVGRVNILNPAENTKISVDYRVAGVFFVPKTYWMVDHGDDYRWFIVTDPKFKTASIFTRSPRPSPAEVQMLTRRLQNLGYDTARLEFPTEFPPGRGEPSPQPQE
jgi:apolipoprotein D and lipocalin family protein